MTEERMICERKGHKPYPVETSKGETVLYDSRYWVPVEPAPPSDWQERLHKVAELTAFISETGDGTEAGFNSIDVAISRLKDAEVFKLQIKELEDANRHLAKENAKLIVKLRQKTQRGIK